MRVDENIDNEVFQLLRERGYVRPDLMLGIWFKGNLLCRFTYEHRDSAGFDFGVTDKPVDLRFPNSPPGWWQSKLKPYQYWLRNIGRDAAEFSQACGGWVNNGLQAPNFEKLKSIIGETLAKIESQSSNMSMNSDADQRRLS